jgi:hypothetical protein
MESTLTAALGNYDPSPTTSERGKSFTGKPQPIRLAGPLFEANRRGNGSFWRRAQEFSAGAGGHKAQLASML